MVDEKEEKLKGMIDINSILENFKKELREEDIKEIKKDIEDIKYAIKGIKLNTHGLGGWLMEMALASSRVDKLAKSEIWYDDDYEKILDPNNEKSLLNRVKDLEKWREYLPDKDWLDSHHEQEREYAKGLAQCVNQIKELKENQKIIEKLKQDNAYDLSPIKDFDDLKHRYMRNMVYAMFMVEANESNIKELKENISNIISIRDELDGMWQCIKKVEDKQKTEQLLLGQAFLDLVNIYIHINDFKSSIQSKEAQENAEMLIPEIKNIQNGTTSIVVQRLLKNHLKEVDKKMGKKKEKKICKEHIVKLIYDVYSKIDKEAGDFISEDELKETIEKNYKIELDWRVFLEALDDSEEEGTIVRVEGLYYTP